MQSSQLPSRQRLCLVALKGIGLCNHISSRITAGTKVHGPELGELVASRANPGPRTFVTSVNCQCRDGFVSRSHWNMLGPTGHEQALSSPNWQGQLRVQTLLRILGKNRFVPPRQPKFLRIY